MFVKLKVRPKVKTVLKMTPEEVYKNLVNQGGPSATLGGEGDRVFCRYRGPNGRKCAAGWRIPDEEYDPNMEGVNVSAIGLNDFEIELMQEAHDRAANASLRYGMDWEETLRANWRNCNLPLPEVE